MTRNISLALILTLISTSYASAQTPAAKPKDFTRLMVLLGDWKGDATFTQGGKTYSFIYHASFKATADSMGLYMDEWFHSDELGKLMGSNLIGYNSNDKKIHWFSVDNFGTTHDHLGAWKSDNHFYMQANETQNNKSFVEKIDLTFQGNNSMKLQLVGLLNGKETERVLASFTRSE